MRAIRIHETGGAERLQWDEVPVPEPKAGEVRIRVEAVGVNFIEIYQRSGLYSIPLPGVLGLEAAGAISAVGPGVTGWAVGQRIATVKAEGAYAQETIVPAAHAVEVPSSVTAKQAAAVLLQGMTAHYLAYSTYPLKPGDTALVHAAAGGVGLLLIQIAKRCGARVLGTVGDPAKAALAKQAGADEIVLYRQEDFAAAVKRLTGGRGVDVVYDSVGKDTFEGSLNSLRPRGMMVSYGNASGPVPPFAPLLLTQKGSLFFTRPSLAHHTLTREELIGRTTALFGWMKAGQLDVRIGGEFPLEKAADAHRALESRGTTGKLLLIP
jgi:NADPH2:quinone reductase